MSGFRSTVGLVDIWDNGEEECYEKKKTKPVRPVDGQGASAPTPVPVPVPAPDLTPTRVDLRVKLDAQRARRDLNNQRRGKRVVFEVSEARAHPEASASGSKRDGEELHVCDAPEIVATEVRQTMSVVDVETEGTGVGLHSTPGDDHQEGGALSELGQAVHEESASEPVVHVGPDEATSDIVQAVAVAREEQLPACVQNTLAQDFFHLATEAEDWFLAPTADGVVQTDEDEVVRTVACHRRGRSMGNGGGSTRHSTSPDRGRTVSPPRRIATMSTVRSTNMVD
ncbi:UNVERIFIED_CONTAM: hypothetical protein Slati_2933300 [Sesamum latifolium]|uniref:Uncharacterized protein n=1 Tax=Sesamum latifolium TaxID=2727402 RepID=A0AAW2VDA4_9LAMI